MTEHVWGWKVRGGTSVIVPRAPRKTIEELYEGSSFGLPVREVPSHVPIRVVLQDGKWIEDTETEADRLWRTVVAASSR